MDATNSLYAVLTGLVIRLAIPIGITLVAVIILRKVDARWRKEADQLPVPAVEKPLCWEISECDPSVSEDCPARASPLPCWQFYRLSNGYLNEKCLTCKVFLQAPPAPAIHAYSH